MDSNDGFTFIEILIAWVILAGVFFSIMTFQIESIRQVHHAYLISIATTQLSNMLERLRVNHSIRSRRFELKQWNIINKQVLPEGEGSFICSKRLCQLKLQWHENSTQILQINALL